MSYGDQPVHVAPKKKTGPLIGLILSGLAVLCLLGCGGAIVYNLFNGEDDPSTTSTKPTVVATTPKAAAVTPSPTKSPEWDPKVKECVKNTGTDSDPNLEPATCAKGTYKIVGRVPNTTDVNGCKTGPFAAKESYDATYWYRSGSGIYQYVLCLKKQ